ncbi:MAG TPA: hypothetical protein VJU61_22995 [Polyangiaceae bacterium]|nr:hypothetical protein [Polyangiaceae bacterium]
MKTKLTSLAFVLSSSAWACTPAGTEPHAMSAAEHQAAASQEEKSSEAHAEQFQPQASSPVERCGPAGGGSVKGAGVVCWTSLQNPTAEHSEEADHHRELAAKHRAASDALRSAEASVCSGIDEEDRDLSPFAHREDIRSVSQVNEEVKTAKGTSLRSRAAGATVVFQAVPGMTAEWLQRLVDCHLARNAAIGHAAASAEMSYCPLTLRGAKASVRSVGDGFAITIQSEDNDTSKEIIRRAESLAPGAVASK